MIVSEKWLREWVNPDLDTAALAHCLTMAGLEVDSVTPVGEGLSGVVVAEIVSAEQHPDADKLRVCQVNTGSEIVQIVCGAPNAAAGLKAPLAQPGAVLPGNIKIKKAKLRGVESQGMLCSGAELTFSDDHDGLLALPADAPVGQSIVDYFDLDDHLIEIGLTPNRADCLSVMGVARDLAVLTGAPLQTAAIQQVPASIDDVFPVRVMNPEKCPRYIGRVVRGVDLSRPTPTYIVERLRRAGIRSIDAAVDITNYVMLELGQPMHAFDLDTLKGGIVVRDAEPDERIVLLDGEERTLRDGVLLIADEDKPLAMGGIMGGEGSGVSAGTTNLFLEAAFFAPQPMAGVAREYGLHTDASHRFERGVDYELPLCAMERATALVCELVGGMAGPVIDVTDPAHLPQREPVALRQMAIRKLLERDISDVEVTRILSGLGFEVFAEGDSWHCTAPAWRFDVEQEADLLEELARVIGYDQFPAVPLRAALNPIPIPEARQTLRALKARLMARGFSEAITFSFISPELHKAFNPETDPIALRNPISAELAVMRSSLIPGLVHAVAHNVKRQIQRVRLFESGMRFLPGEPFRQERRLALAITGTRAPESWASHAQSVDFFDLKGEVELLLAGGPRAPLFRPAVRPGLHDGQTAEVWLGDELVGVLGCLHPLTAKAWDVPARTFVAELDLERISDATVPSYSDISKYPEVRRDLAVVVAKSVPAASVLELVEAQAGPGLSHTVVFDTYQGDGIGEDEKSLALGLTFRDQSRTLTDDEISAALAQVVDSLEKELGARLRA